MTVVRFLDRIETLIEEVFETRAAPDDEVEWAASLVPTVEGCEDHERVSMAVSVYAKMACPETGTKCVATWLVPISDCTEDDDVREWIGSIWDQMVVARMNRSLADVPGSA